MKQWSTEADWDNSQSSDAIVTHDQKGEYPPSVVETQPQLVESGIVEINKTINLGRTKEIEFEKEYETPVIITQTVTNNDSDPIGSGTKNVTEDSFEIYLDYDLSIPDNVLLPNPPSTDTGSKGVVEDISGNAEGFVIDNGSIQLCSAYEALSAPVGKHATEKVAYLVMEAGGYSLNGFKFSAQTIETNQGETGASDRYPDGRPMNSYSHNVDFDRDLGLPGHAASNMTRRNGVNIDLSYISKSDYGNYDNRNIPYVPGIFNDRLSNDTDNRLNPDLEKEVFGVITYTINEDQNENISTEYIETYEIDYFENGEVTINFENDYDKPPLIFISQVDFGVSPHDFLYPPKNYINPNVTRNTESATFIVPENRLKDRDHTVLIVDQDYGWNPDSHRSQVRATLTTEKK